MIGTELVRELVECVILTGRIKKIEPVSLLLIAAPESGKTSIALERPCTAIEAFADITGKGLHHILKERGHDITHIIINDMVAVLSHRQSVNKYTISQLNAWTEEGIHAIATPMGIERFNSGGVRGGVIASLTLELAKDSRMWWKKVGFTSRMLPFCYRYPDELNIRIKDFIDDNRGRKEDKKQAEFKVPKEEKIIEYPELYAKHVRRLADSRSIALKEDGKRRLKQYHALIQAHALWRKTNKPSVIEKDLDFLFAIDRFVSYTDPQPL